MWQEYMLNHRKDGKIYVKFGIKDKMNRLILVKM